MTRTPIIRQDTYTVPKATRTQGNNAVKNMGQHVLQISSQATPEDKRKFNELISSGKYATGTSNTAVRVMLAQQRQHTKEPQLVRKDMQTQKLDGVNQYIQDLNYSDKELNNISQAGKSYVKIKR